MNELMVVAVIVSIFWLCVVGFVFTRAMHFGVQRDKARLERDIAVAELRIALRDAHPQDPAMQMLPGRVAEFTRAMW